MLKILLFLIMIVHSYLWACCKCAGIFQPLFATYLNCILYTVNTPVFGICKSISLKCKQAKIMFSYKCSATCNSVVIAEIQHILLRYRNQCVRHTKESVIVLKALNFGLSSTSCLGDFVTMLLNMICCASLLANASFFASSSLFIILKGQHNGFALGMIKFLSLPARWM